MPESENSEIMADDFRVITRIYPGVAYLSITQYGITKRVQTTRRGLEIILEALQASLDNPLSNENGRTVNNVRG